MCHLTDHAVQRTKERVGLPKRSAEKNAQKALESGIRHCETKGSLNRYITALYWKQETANNIRIYCNNVYIFNNDVLITVFPLPRCFAYELSVSICFFPDLGVWDDFHNILVLDEEFGQPYTPFYSENYKKDIKGFPVLEYCIRQCNDFLDSFDFLEEVKEEDDGSE